MKVFAVCLSLVFSLTCLFSLPIPLSIPFSGFEFSMVSEAQAKGKKTVRVRSYTKKTGTVVRAHTRSKKR